jgi:SAM-dependent methyltransferase
MQYQLHEWLKCPVTKTPLRLQVLTEFEKNYRGGPVKEIKDGLLFSEAGFVFPIIDGIPRMLVEAIYDYQFFLKQHFSDYAKVRIYLENNYNDLLKTCIRRNKKTKKTFEFEWSFLQPHKKDRIWQESVDQLTDVFLKEAGEQKEFFTGKSMIDIGAGHGLMTAKMSEIGKLAVGVEISKAIESAYKRNNISNAWYIQADLQHLPFADNAFDVLYSSGVIHHTPDTEKSLSLIHTSLKQGGKICLWLYHPQKSKLHNLSLQLRKLTRRLPLWLSATFLILFIFPFTFLIKTLHRKKGPNYREEIIDLLDAFTPEFRYEVPQETAMGWLNKRGYKNAHITSTNRFGFSITGTK